MRRAGLAAALVLLAALTAGAAHAAPRPVACPQLVADMAQKVQVDREQAAFERRYPPPPPAEAGLYDPVGPAYRLMSPKSVVGCWKARRGRAVDAPTRQAVELFSRLSLGNYLARMRGERRADFFTLKLAFRIERATGVEGPISRRLRRQGLAFLSGPDLTLEETFTGIGERNANDLYDLLPELTALCLADPRGFAAHAAALKVGRATLAAPMWGETRGLVDAADNALFAYGHAEADRLLAACPL